MVHVNPIAGRYKLVEKLGEGGMGVVCKAYDRLEREEVALKQVLIPENELDFATKAGTHNSQKLRLSLAREFSILATLRHPNILSVLDYGFDEHEYPFYTMALLEDGQDCRAYAETLPWVQKVELLAQILQALHYLHRRGILHRDLKPDNVLVSKEGQVKVMDFGLAKIDNKLIQSSKDGNITGTVLYMAPELFQGGKASIASDLYAFGVMAYEILVGAYPYVYDNIGMLIMQIMTETIYCDDLPADLAIWLEDLLGKDPVSRPDTAYDALLGLYAACDLAMPAENVAIRESFLQASSFVGREVELRQLTDALDALSAGDGANTFFLVGGESGVGKSRLLDELRIRALVVGVDVLRGQGVEGGGLPFQMWRNIARRLLLLADVTDFQAGVLKELVPDASELLGREIVDVPELAGSAYQERIVLTIIDLLRAVQRPAVLLLEDLQWALQSLAPLTQILLVRAQLPMLMIVGSYRTDEAPTLPETLAEMTHVRLDRLDGEAIQALSKAMLGDVGTNAAITQLIQTESEGNAFFIIETVRALAEASGQLEQIGRAALPTSVFTGGMQAVMSRHLNKVDGRYQEMQTLAAVIGREIDTQVLAHHYEAEMVEAWLTHAAEYGVVDVQENSWRFAHDKLRETAVAGIDQEQKPLLHRAVAEAIESVYPDQDGYNEELLAHWREADDLDKELGYLDPVADQMINIQGVYDTAETLLEHALGRLPQGDPRCVSLLNRLASVHVIRGRHAEATRKAELARQIAKAVGNDQGLAASLGHLGSVAYRRGDYDRIIALYEQRLEISRAIDDQAHIADSLNGLGNVALKQGEYDRAVAFYHQSIAIWQALDDRRSVTRGLINLGGIALQQEDYGRAAELFQEALTIRQQLGDMRGIARSLNNLGLVAYRREKYDEATALYEQCLAICQQLGEQNGLAISLHNLGNLAVDQRAYGRGLSLFQQSLATRRAFGDQRGVGLELMHIGWVYLKQGDDQARPYFVQSLRIVAEIGIPVLQLFNVVCFAGWLHQQGDSAQAAELLGFAQQHPATDVDMVRRLTEVMAQVEAALPVVEWQAAVERGQQFELESVLQNLLEQFAFVEDEIAGTEI